MAVLSLGLAGCAGSSTGPFSWQHPQAAPTQWKVAVISTGASLAYPPSWRAQRGDTGTATAALMGPRDRFLGYLNLTPRQGDETLANWSSFRVEHVAEDGDHNVRRLAAAQRLRFLSGQGSCVKDAYTTRTNQRFVEIACLVSGGQGESVIVAAAPPQVWDRESATLERAIDAVRA
ncbi:MAG: hypothetical protein JO244_02950 [Solirubrobacterales bacterium]|nr:hypothetical protein [Solirubrobacterales bacterium]